MCQGLLSCRRHIGKREDPGDEVGCHAVNVSDNAAYFYNKINEDLRTGGIDVKTEDIIDIIDSYKGGGYGGSTQHELGG